MGISIDCIMNKWNELSMAERAKYIKLGVEQGITDINNISSAYNSYADGGTLPELVVTPRMNYTHYTGDEYITPTLSEYKDARRNEIRANALLAMQNDNEPYVPLVPNKLGRAFKTVAGDWFDDDDVMFIFGKDNNPSTCISTVSSKYGRMVPGNKTFYDRSEDLGFVRIPENEREHGDIVQTVGRRGVPSHAAMVSGFTRDGRMLIDESHGGKTSETIEHDIDYFDTDPSLKNKLYYRFIGNDDDNRRWETEYDSLFPTKANRFDTGGPKPSNRERIASIIASNSAFTSVDVDKALANYLDSKASREAIELPEFTVTAKTTSKGDNITTFNPRDTEQNLKYRDKVRKASIKEPWYVNWLKDYIEDKDLVYSIMAGKYGVTYGTTREIPEIIRAMINKEEYSKNRSNFDRNLSSLYIYGNDLGQFKEAPELRNVGVEYDNYLKRHGINPDEVKTYKGHIPARLSLPNIIKSDVINFIKSDRNHTFKAEETSAYDNLSWDNVANFVQRLSLDKEGNPIIVNSDLWDFDKDYATRWDGNSITNIKADLLSRAGTPFILKNVYPVNFIDIDRFYDEYEKNYNQSNIAKEFGFLPTLSVIYNKTDNKQYTDYPWSYLYDDKYGNKISDSNFEKNSKAISN